MQRLNRSVVLGVMAAAVAFSTPLLAEEPNGPFENLKYAPVKVTWQYSNDGGKTFGDKALPPPPPGVQKVKDVIDTSMYQYAWKGAFEVADPSKVGGLFVRIFEVREGGTDPRASICNGDINAAAGGYWKDLGFCPTLLDAVIKVNGKEVEMARGPVLMIWVPLANLKAGQNTIELSGHVYSYWGGASWTGNGPKPGPITGLDAKIIAAEPQPAKIFNGPVLGDAGDGYFTLACRTQLPADLTVEATPVEPAGAAVKVTSAGAIWHRLRIEVPKGTRKLSYTVSAKVGPHETKRGPYAVTLPGKDFRFIAYGFAQQHAVPEASWAVDPWGTASRQILKAQPDFLCETGNMMEQESWSFHWEAAYTGMAAELLARVPMLSTPCSRDWTGIYNELHVTPAADRYSHNWTKVVGPVRFICIDGNEVFAPGNAGYKWLEGVLSEAKEKFVVVLSGYPGYSSGVNSKGLYGGRKQARQVIMPLLDKYKATVMLSCWDPGYERIEPLPGKGCTQIVASCIGWKRFHRFNTEFGSHGQGPTGPGFNARTTSGLVKLPDGREWCGYCGARHFCVFDVKGDTLTMKVLDCGGNPDADTKELKVLDEKTFKPRS